MDKNIFYCPECDYHPTRVRKAQNGSYYRFYCLDCGGELWTQAEIDAMNARQLQEAAAELASLDRVGKYMEACGGA